MENEDLNLDPALCNEFASLLESNDEARLAAVVPMVAHQAAEQDIHGH